MNASIPTEIPQDIEKDIDNMLAQINEILVDIRRDREEGAQIVAEGEAIRQSNAEALKKLDETLARLK